MNRYIVAVLVNNQFGVLNRVTSMFRRRQFNISTLTVSETECPEYSRITVSFEGEENNKQQLMNQLYKLPDVISLDELNTDGAVSFELLLIKLKNEEETKADILASAARFGAELSETTNTALIIRLTDDSRRIDAFIGEMRRFSILEICRTGIVSLSKSGETLLQKRHQL